MLAVQKTLKLILGLLIFNTSLFGTSFFSEEKLLKLSQASQWHRLLHFKNKESEIDDKTFFFSKNGKTNPKAELKAYFR